MASVLLYLALAIKYYFIKPIFKDEIIHFWVNSLKNAIKAKKFYFWYFINALKAKIRLENSLKIIILLDTGVKINVIIRKVIKDIDLAMQHSLKIELISYISYSRFF